MVKTTSLLLQLALTFWHDLTQITLVECGYAGGFWFCRCRFGCCRSCCVWTFGVLRGRAPMHLILNIWAQFVRKLTIGPFYQAETLLQLLGSAGLIQLVSTKLLFAKVRQHHLQCIHFLPRKGCQKCSPAHLAINCSHLSWIARFFYLMSFLSFFQ